MNRSLLLVLLSPEIVLSVVTAAVFVFCSRFNSYSDSDVDAISRLAWLLPVFVVPLAFATVWVPGAKTWVWLTRVNIALALCLFVCAYRIVAGFGAPGSGPKGQDVGFILILALGSVFAALANAFAVAAILRERHAGVDRWFDEHGFAGALVTALSSVPLFFIQVFGMVITLAVPVFFIELFKK